MPLEENWRRVRATPGNIKKVMPNAVGSVTHEAFKCT